MRLEAGLRRLRFYEFETTSGFLRCFLLRFSHSPSLLFEPKSNLFGEA